MNPRLPDMEVWALLDGSSSPPSFDGFLVTDCSRLPRLVAFVEGRDEIAFLTALKIAEGKRSPETATNDLRGRAVPDFLMRKPILPMKPGEGKPVIGMFSTPAHGSEAVFTLATNAALRQIGERLNLLASERSGGK